MATILVVDDEPTILTLCQRILELGGYEVLTASGGEEALRTLQNRAIDLALLDIMMPGLNGIELAARIKKTYSDLPTVLMTGYSLREIQHVVGPHNPYRVIWKPFKTESLLQMIENVLQGQPSGDGT
jgi:two-component system alkaline phosphatase synthesis response regulator PhoP